MRDRKILKTIQKPPSLNSSGASISLQEAEQKVRQSLVEENKWQTLCSYIVTLAIV